MALTRNNIQRRPPGRPDGGQFSTSTRPNDPDIAPLSLLAYDDDAPDESSTDETVEMEIEGLPVELASHGGVWELEPSWALTQLGVQIDMANAEDGDLRDPFNKAVRAVIVGNALADLINAGDLAPQDAQQIAGVMGGGEPPSDLDKPDQLRQMLVDLSIHEGSDRFWLTHSASGEPIDDGSAAHSAKDGGYAPDWLSTVAETAELPIHKVWASQLRALPNPKHQIMKSYREIVGQTAISARTASPSQVAALCEVGGGEAGDTDGGVLARVYDRCNRVMAVSDRESEDFGGYFGAAVMVSKSIEVGRDVEHLKEWLQRESPLPSDLMQRRLLEAVVEPGPDQLAAASAYAALWSDRTQQDKDPWAKAMSSDAADPGDTLNDWLRKGLREPPSLDDRVTATQAAFREHPALAHEIGYLRYELAE